MPEPNCKSCKHYFDGHNGAIQPRCKLVMDRIKQRIEEGNATTDELLIVTQHKTQFVEEE